MIPVLFENEDFLAVNKTEGLASIPERSKEKNSLLALLSPGYSTKLYVVHRLDKEASGVMLFAKNASSHKFMSERFSSREIRKTYLILVHGFIPAAEGTIEKPLRQFGSGRMGVDAMRGKKSTTEFSVLERFGSHTLAEVHPVTGRRHQIRVHFYSIGHPVVGDLRYGDKALQELYPRLMLHAQRIECRLPSGHDLNIEAPIPESFELVLKKSRNEK
jgi:tRNA pseudouridine32 synthase/23S rRNA pseudouridine746 synthase